MDDLIVIILTLIIAGAGALGQLKKKKRNAPVESDEQPESNQFWDLIQGESNIPGQMQSDEFEEPDSVMDTGNKTYQEKDVIKTVSYDAKPQYEKGAVLRDEIRNNAKEPKLKSKLIEDFSLRKAVIYSEILNRKYT